MTQYRTLLVEAEPEGHACGRVRAAADLARRFGARLTGVGAALAPIAMRADPFNDTLEHYNARIGDELVLAEANFRKQAEGIDVSWIGRRAMPSRVMFDAAAEADLIVCGGAEQPDNLIYRAARPGALALSCGRPVLIVAKSGETPTGDKIVIAWKEGPEARRAAMDALPFLTTASEVLVLRLCEPGDADDSRAQVEAAARHLTTHGVKASGEARLRGREPVADELVSAAGAFGADLIVSGAYGRTRLDDWVFGGVTRRLLAQDAISLLISK